MKIDKIVDDALELYESLFRYDQGNSELDDCISFWQRIKNILNDAEMGDDQKKRAILDADIDTEVPFSERFAKYYSYQISCLNNTFQTILNYPEEEDFKRLQAVQNVQFQNLCNIQEAIAEVLLPTGF